MADGSMKVGRCRDIKSVVFGEEWKGKGKGVEE